MASSEGEPEYPREDRGGQGANPLSAAKRRARRRIDEDRRRHPEDLKPVFEALAARLFEPGFDANLAALNPAARLRFRLKVGATLRAYRDRQLLDTAMDLVCGSELLLAEIAEALGFGDLVSFRKWFKWRTGEAPQALRTGRRDGSAAASQVAPAADEVFPGWSMPQIRLALLGGVSRERAADLMRQIREAYPHLDSQPPATD